MQIVIHDGVGANYDGYVKLICQGIGIEDTCFSLAE